MAELPPWLNVGPQNYLAATEAGGKAGQDAAGMAIQQQQFAQQQALKQQELMQAQKQFQDEQRYKAQQANIANEYNRMQMQQRAEEQASANAQAAAKFEFEKQQGMASEAMKQREYDLNASKLGVDTKFNYDKLNADMAQHTATTNLQQKKDVEDRIKDEITQAEKEYETLLSIAQREKNPESKKRLEEKASMAKREANAARLRLNAAGSAPVMGQAPPTPASAFGASQGMAPQPVTRPDVSAPSASAPMAQAVPPSQGEDQSQGPITYTSPQGATWTATPASTGKKSFQKTSGDLAGLYEGLSADESYSPQQREMFKKMAKDFAGDAGARAATASKPSEKASYPAPPTLPDPLPMGEQQTEEPEPKPSFTPTAELEARSKDNSGSVFDDFNFGKTAFNYQTEQAFKPSKVPDLGIKTKPKRLDIILEEPTDVMQSPEHKSLTTKYNKLVQEKYQDPQFKRAFDKALVKVLDLRKGVENEKGFSGKYTFDSMMKHVHPEKRMKFYKEVMNQYDQETSEAKPSEIPEE